MCMRHTGTPAPATTSAMRGSPRIADTSFTNDAPAAMAASATTAFVVSIEIGTSVASRRPRITARTRASSTSADTGSDPGRVDSPPTSSTSAPSATSVTPRAIAVPGSRYSPPSENESGVTLITPMTAGGGNRSGSGATGGILEWRRRPPAGGARCRFTRRTPRLRPICSSRLSARARACSRPAAAGRPAWPGFRDRIDRLVGVDLDESGGRMNESLDEFAVADLCGTLPVPRRRRSTSSTRTSSSSTSSGRRRRSPSGTACCAREGRSSSSRATARTRSWRRRASCHRACGRRSRAAGPGAAARDVFPARYRANTPGGAHGPARPGGLPARPGRPRRDAPPLRGRAASGGRGPPHLRARPAAAPALDDRRLVPRGTSRGRTVRSPSAGAARSRSR